MPASCSVSALNDCLASRSAVERGAPADVEPVPQGDEGLREAAARPGEPGRPHADAARPGLAAGATLALIAAGRERLVPGAGEDDYADRAVGPRGAERADQLVDRERAEGIAHLGPVDGDPGDAIARLVEDVLVRHRPPFGQRRPLVNTGHAEQGRRGNMLETALHAHLAARGAAHADDRGVALPRHFGDAAAEYRALRQGAALIDLGFRTVVRAVGTDRVPFLQGMVSNDVAALRPGEGSPALLLTIQGRIVADVRVAA